MASSAVCTLRSAKAATLPLATAWGKRAHRAARPSVKAASASNGRPPAASKAASSVAGLVFSGAWLCSHSAVWPGCGQRSAKVWQRLRIVGSNWCAASVAKTNFSLPLGSSSVLSRALAVMLFMRSAGYTSTASPRPRPLVSCANSIISRMASTRISLLGLRFLSSMSFCAFSASGQPSSNIRVSGISTATSGWARLASMRQLGHWPQAGW